MDWGSDLSTGFVEFVRELACTGNCEPLRLGEWLARGGGSRHDHTHDDGGWEGTGQIDFRQ
jgi:hypothetical protein